ncbi:MAG TPA: protein kinase [Steroidobacteraceae bacterium]|nr:protein kinase [Steroidobacteraceae bacterium]
MASMPGNAPDAQWTRIQDLFVRALELPKEHRGDFIAHECPNEPELAQEVLSLIACDLGTGTGPITNAMGNAIEDTTRERRSAMVGEKIGAYRITAVLGHGGTGTVYLGERADDQYSAKVAIKLVDSAAIHPEMRMRFRAERQILANLNHPNIARLIDAGETDDDRPYLVMEYVEGRTAEVYCDQHRLSIDDRLELFLKVCAAVQYAHQNLVVHRDLKPANVLVTADGTPKLLDFGIAKLLDAGSTGVAQALTRMNDRLLTPEYAAPEQILGQAVTTASDVYALGTVLYELLTGMRPFLVPSSTTQLELERLICISDPLRPSAAIKRAIEHPIDTSAGAHDIAAARDSSPERLMRRLSGDVDAICMRALRKEPQHRYSSVEQLADDVRRYLAHEPVIARQGNWFYYSNRFVRKHAFGVSAATTLILFVVVFAVVMSLQAQRIAAERDRATQERSRAETVSSFMLDVFGAADPFISQGREITARELLDQAARRIDSGLAQQPEVRVQLLEAIGQAYGRQGYYGRAVDHFERARQLRQRLPQTDNAAQVNLLIELAKAQRSDGRLAAANTTLHTAEELLNRSKRQSGIARARLVAALGRLYLDQSDWRSGEKYLTESVALIRSSAAQEPFELVDILRDLSSAQFWKGDVAIAEKTMREAVTIARARLPELHPSRVLAEGVLAELLANSGRANEEAAELLQRVLRARRSLYGEVNSDVADTLDVLAKLRTQQGKWQEAEQLFRQALSIQERALGPDHFLVGYQHNSLASFLLMRHEPTAAEQEARMALHIYAKALPADHQYVAFAEHVLGEALIAERRYREAEQILVAARDRWTRAGAPAWRIGRTMSALGDAVYRQQRTEEAEQLLIQGYRDVASDPGATAEARARTRERLVNFYRATGQSEKIASALKVH